MTAHVFSFHDTTLHALPSGALWLAEARALVVWDRHLGKGDGIARREGRLTPPYEVAETLGRWALPPVPVESQTGTTRRPVFS